MRHLFPALALASVVSLFAAVPMASAQYGGGSTSDGSTLGSGMGSGMPPGMGPGGMGMSPSGGGMGLGAAPSLPSASSTSVGAVGQPQQFTCALGQVVPFQVPVQGLDQNGRPYFFLTNGWYGPYDGFGYPIVTQMIGQYGGTPMQRQSQGYIPSPCPVAPGVPLSAMSYGTMAGYGMGSMPMGSMGPGMAGAPGMSPMGPMAPGPMMPPAGQAVPMSMGPAMGPAAPALGGLVGPTGN